jgi:hypothetical protein
MNKRAKLKLHPDDYIVCHERGDNSYALIQSLNKGHPIDANEWFFLDKNQYTAYYRHYKLDYHDDIAMPIELAKVLGLPMDFETVEIEISFRYEAGLIVITSEIPQRFRYVVERDFSLSIGISQFVDNSKVIFVHVTGSEMSYVRGCNESD